MKQLLLGFLAFFSATCFAAAPSDESVTRLFSLMKVEAMMDGIYSSILPIMRQSMSQANGGKTLSAEETRKIELLSSKLGEILKREMSWAKFEPIQRAIYRENFDQVEIDGLITFYQSAVGQSFINKMPMITQKSMAVMPAFIQEVMPRIQSEMQKIVADVESGKLK